MSATQQILVMSSGVAPPAAYLDELTAQPRAVWSLRKLISTATNALRVRRSSDNAEQDIGFTGDDLDSTALLAFVGANSGYVVTWYDQTGNALHLLQATAAKQYRLVNAGVYSGSAFSDGIDDAYSVASLSVNTTDKASVYFRLGISSFNRYNNIFELSVNYASQGGAAAIVYTNNVSGGTVESGMSNVNVWNSTAGSLNVSSFLTTDVVGFIWDRAQATAANEIKLYLNGAQKTQFSSSALNTTGNFGAFTGYIGARAAGTTGASLYDFHSMIVYMESTSAEIAEITDLIGA